MSSKATCKEQCTKCKCIVKERELNGGKMTPVNELKKSKSKNGNGSNGNGNGSNGYNGNNGSKVPCLEVYRDLGECLQKAILAASQTKKEDDWSC